MGSIASIEQDRFALFLRTVCRQGVLLHGLGLHHASRVCSNTSILHLSHSSLTRAFPAMLHSSVYSQCGDLACMCISELGLDSKTCGLQGTFIVFQDKVKPGKNFTGTQLFDTGGAFYNVPGFMDNLKVSLMTSIIILLC